jgi:hypothetical protein
MPDATGDWPPVVARAVTLDLRTRSIHGVTLGAPVDTLRRIGRPANRRATVDGHFVYPDLGVTIHCEQDRICDIELCFDPEEGPTAQEATIQAPGGAKVTLSPGAKLSTLDVLGEPQIQRGEDYIVATWKLGSNVLEAECASDDTIHIINFFVD